MAETSSAKPQYAGFGPRCLAIFIDTLIYFPIYFLEKIIYPDQTGAMVVAVLLNLSGVIYFILMLGLCGQTVGMMATKIKVVRLDLSPLRWSNAVLRYIVNVFLSVLYLYVEICLLAQAGPEIFTKNLFEIQMSLTRLDDSFESFMHYFLALSYAWTLSELVVLLLNEKKRAIHDYIGGTVVVLLGGKEEILFDSQPPPSSPLIKIFTVLIVLGGVCGAMGFGLYEFYLKSKLNKFLAPPAQLQTSGVRKGQGFVTKGLLLERSGIGETTDLVPDPSNPGAFLAAGKRGILSLRSTGEIIHSNFFDFRTRINDLRWVVMGNWVGLMNRGSWTHPAFMMDRDGKTLWTYDVKKGIDDMTAGNIGGDSKPKFVVGMNGAGGIHLLDEAGQQIWEMPGHNVWNVGTADIDGDGKDEIIHTDAGGKLTVRNEKGDVVKEYQPSVYADYFCLVPWTQGGERWVAVLKDKSKFLFFSLLQGSAVAEWDSGIEISTGKSRGLWVDWSAGGGPGPWPC